MQDVLSKPVELIDQDLDAVAGGFGFVDVNVNIADIDQFISQTQASANVASVAAVDQDQSAANVASITQLA
jgi:hypothetical protein